MLKKYFKKNVVARNLFLIFTGCYSYVVTAQVVFEREVKITDIGLHFNGSKIGSTSSDNGNSNSYDFYFGRNISAHGDCIKTYGDYVFMTWYKGGKQDRNVMLTRYNTKTGTAATIEFPHRHTGYQNKWWIGESHNTIAVGISPLNGTIHLLYDMHAYSASRPSNGSLSNDYFRYSYSVTNAASVSDAEFTLDKFVKNSQGGYKHLRLTGSENQNEFVALTYPKFFLNDAGDIFMYMREGGNNNGAYKFSKYSASTSTWSRFTQFNVLGAKSNSAVTFNWGLYGNMKYVNGKMRIGFQRRSANNNDKYLYQNGVYYAYSDDQSGASNWKNHRGQSFSLPLYDADVIKVMEPGDYVQTTQANKVYIVGSFDWTVTENGDVHIISKVKDNQYNVTKYLHTYKPAGATNFITSVNPVGGSSLYTSGDSVFIIGLKNNRVFVQKAVGGTNNFTTVYQATSGRTFDHGKVYINNGKLYYYLMEKKSGTAQPLYLQIIDLGIEDSPMPFAVNLITPTDNQTFKQDHIVPLYATATADEGEITKVSFFADGTLLSEDNTKPYSFDWTPNALGPYTVKAVAYKTGGASITSSEATITVVAVDKSDLTNDVYRLRNMATGKFLTDAGVSAGAASMSDSAEAQNTHWTFIPSGDYFNIDSEAFGILRATGDGFSGGANLVVSTSKSPPAGDTDKTFTIHYNDSDDTFRFEARNNSKYLYHATDGSVVNISVAETDARSKWKAISTSQSLSIEDQTLSTTSIQLFPNPAEDQFTVLLNGVNNANVMIYSMLGKVIYQKTMTSGRIDIENNGRFKTGIYLIKVIDKQQRVFHSKLMIR